MTAPHPFTPGASVAAYLRDSGHEEQELSIAQQEAEIQKFCAQNALTLTRLFKDAARPGSSVVGRQAFQEAIRHFRGKPEEAGLVIWKFSRFARDIDDAQFYKADLRRRGFIVHSLMDKIPHGPEGRFFEAALDWMNQKFLEDLSTDVKRGLRHLVEQYRCVPGVPPRGIRRIPVVIGKHRDGRDHLAHRWEPDPAWVKRIQMAFQMKANGESLTAIREATGLYRSTNSYKKFFQNKIWLGILEYGELATLEDYCAPVITREVWDQVQAQLNAHAQKQHASSTELHPRRKNSPYLLSGLLYCARCGAAMSGASSRNGYGQLYERYQCGRAKRRGDCSQGLIGRARLERTVLADLVSYLNTGDHLALLEELSGEVEETPLQSKRESLMETLSLVKRRLENAFEALLDLGKSPTLQMKITDLEAQKASLTTQLAALEAELAQHGQGLAQEEICHALAPSFDQATLDQLRPILKAFIGRVCVDRGPNRTVQVTVYYHGH